MNPTKKGRVYLRGRIYWIAYSFRGNEIRESTHTSDEKTAWKLLDKRFRERERPNFVGPKQEKWTLDDMEQKIRAHYERKENRSFDTVKRCFSHLKRHFPFHRVIDIDTKEIEAYQATRLKEGASRASVNREVAYLRAGFRLMFAAKEISELPLIRLLDGERVREGFLSVSDFDRLVKEFADPNVRDIVEFLYNSGWRSGEAKKLQWNQVDMHSRMICLVREHSKNKRPRLLPITGRLGEIIDRRLQARRIDCPYVFHRGGRPIRSFLRVFKTVAKAIGQPALLPHDMRRSAVRNFRKAGLSETEGMMLSGHKTNSTYRRYNIIDEQDLLESMERVQEHLKKEVAAAKVVPLRRPA